MARTTKKALNQAAALLGSIGGKARAKKLTAERRTQIARDAAKKLKGTKAASIRAAKAGQAAQATLTTEERSRRAKLAWKTRNRGKKS